MQFPFLSQKLHGKVEYISNRVDPGTHAVRIRTSIENPEGRLKSDMLVRGMLAIPPAAGRTVIPRTALVVADGRYYVYVKVAGREDKFERMARVEIAQERDDPTSSSTTACSWTRTLSASGACSWPSCTTTWRRSTLVPRLAKGPAFTSGERSPVSFTRPPFAQGVAEASIDVILDASFGGDCLFLKAEWVDRFIHACVKVRSARRRSLAAGQTVYSDVPDGQCWVVTAAGYVKVLDPRVDGNRFIRLILGRGGLLGDRPFGTEAFRGFASPQHELAVAHGPAEVLELDRPARSSSRPRRTPRPSSPPSCSNR